jgi:hypothetical protein
MEWFVLKWVTGIPAKLNKNLLLWPQNYFTVLTNTVASHVTAVTCSKFTRARRINPHRLIISSLIYTYILLHTAWQNYELRLFSFIFSRLIYKFYVASVIYGWIGMRCCLTGADGGKQELWDVYVSPCGAVHHMGWHGEWPRPPR